MTQVMLAFAIGAFLLVAYRFVVVAIETFLLGPEGDGGEAEDRPALEAVELGA